MHKDQNNPKLLYSKYVVRIVKVIYTINYMKSEIKRQWSSSSLSQRELTSNWIELASYYVLFHVFFFLLYTR